MSSGRLLQMSGVVVDLIYRVENVPPAGEEARVESFMMAAGGGFNAMVAAKRAGLEVAYGGAHGTGPFADVVRRELAQIGIPLLQRTSSHADQGCCVVLVDGQGERTFISKEGADGILDDQLLGDVDPSGFDWILISGYALAHPGSREALHGWLADLPGDASLLFDPAPAVGRIPEPILAGVVSKAKWVSANAAEAATMTGHESPDAAVRALSAGLTAPAGGAVVRCGSDGCWVAMRGGQPRHLPRFAVESVDTNGAGDIHVGAFIAALSGGADAIAAAEYANAAAALSTTRHDAISAPDDAETLAFLEDRSDAARKSAAQDNKRLQSSDREGSRHA